MLGQVLATEGGNTTIPCNHKMAKEWSGKLQYIGQSKSYVFFLGKHGECHLYII